MSFRGGRGGGASGSGGGFQRSNLPFGLDYSDICSINTSNEKPVIPLPVNGTITPLEKTIGSRFVNFGNLIKDGPFYTGSNLESGKKVEVEGINDGLKRYGDRYLKKRRIGLSIDDHPYAIQFFPEELYKAMGVDDKRKKKLLNLSGNLQNKLMDSLEESKSLLEQLKSSLDDDEKEEDIKANGAGAVDEDEENLDDEFEEDDDDDYNAEKYFDDGEDFGDLDDFDDEAAF